MKHSIIEIKATCNNPDKVRKILKDNESQYNIQYEGLDHQVDTYFKVKNGRLKLREGNIENHLIQYFRKNQTEAKNSEVVICKTEPNSSIKNILTNSLGVLVVVDKKREIYYIDNVKIHIDEVKDLGSFVEVEAISRGDEIPLKTLTSQCAKYKSLLEILDSDLISESYSDMLLSKNNK